MGINLFWCIPIAFIVTGIIGYVTERLLIRRLYGRLLDTLLATWGLALLLQQAIRVEFGLSFFGIHVPGLGSGMQNVPVPELLRRSFEMGGANISVYRLFVFFVTIVLVAFTWYLLKHTSFGTQLRAVTKNRKMAACLGIDDKRINALAFAYGSGLAGIAGVLVAGFKIVSPDMGTPYVIDAFLVVVAGGVGSIVGTVATAGVFGEISAIVATVANDVYGRVAILIAAILILLFRPNGLFSTKSR